MKNETEGEKITKRVFKFKEVLEEGDDNARFFMIEDKGDRADYVDIDTISNVFPHVFTYKTSDLIEVKE